MKQPILRMTVLCAVAVLASSFVAHSDEAVSTPPKVKPPKIMLRAVKTVTLGDQPFPHLTLEVVNPNSASLTFTGYAPDSFDPPLPPGHIWPLHELDLQRDGKWQPYPIIRRCGFGVTDLELPPKSLSTFEIVLPAGEWQAIKVGFGQLAGWSDEEVSTTTIWSAVFTREEFTKLTNSNKRSASKPSVARERAAVSVLKSTSNAPVA